MRGTRWGSLLVASMALAGLLVAGCDDDKCSTGDSCSKACDNGQTGMCVVEGICECVSIGDGGLGGNGGTDDGGPVDNCRAPEPGELVVSEAMIDGDGADGPTEFVEMVNTTGEPLALGGVVLSSMKTSARQDSVTFVAGCMPANGAVAMFYGEADWVWNPAPAPMPSFEIGGYAFGNSVDFDFQLHRGAVMLDQGTGSESLIESGVSVVRSPELTGVFVKHSDLGADSSPGFCANGGRHDEACATEPVGDGGVDGGDEPCPVAVPGDLVINELMPDGETIDGLSEATEFVEFINVSGHRVSLEGVEIYSNSSSGMSKRKGFSAGCMPIDGAVVMAKSADFVQYLPAMGADASGTFTLLNSADFVVELRVGEVVIDRAEGSVTLIDEGVSANRETELLSGAPFVSHAELSVAMKSPGTCVDGASFDTGCPMSPVEGDAGVSDDAGVDAGIDEGVVEDAGADCAELAMGDLVINEVMPDGDIGSDDNEFFEFVNVSGHAVSLASLEIWTNSTAGELSERVTIAGGCLTDRGAVAIAKVADHNVFVPEIVPALVLDGRLSLVNSADFAIELRVGGLVVASANGMQDLIIAGVSATRGVELNPAAPFVMHDVASPNGSSNSPGYCNNGGRFDDDCAAP